MHMSVLLRNKIENRFFCNQVFDVMRKQEKTRLADLEAEKAYHEVHQAQMDIVSDKLLCSRACRI